MDRSPDQVVADQPHRSSSDSEREERVARDKLQKASIANIAETQRTSSEEPSGHPLAQSITAESTNSDEGQPRLRKKRSFEEHQHEVASVENGTIHQPPQSSSTHKRMRSREVTSGDYVPSTTTFENNEALREEEDEDAQKSPGGPGILVDASRNSMSPEPQIALQEETVTSPRRKRSREQVDRTEALVSSSTIPTPAGTSADLVQNQTQPNLLTRDSQSERETKRPRDGAAPEADIQISPSTAAPFSESNLFNTSTRSPFGQTLPSTDPEPATNPQTQATTNSAFASSGLSAFASTAKSPFGASSLSTSNTGGFGAATGPKMSSFASPAKVDTDKPGLNNVGATSPFATNKTPPFGASRSSTFASTTSFAFGGSKLGSNAPSSFGSQGAFGSKPFGSSISSFANSSSTPLGGAFGRGVTKSKAFGEPESDEDEERSELTDEEGGGFGDDLQAGPREHSAGKKQIEQKLTGEEDGKTLFSCRAKLYIFDQTSKAWKERGLGILKLNELKPVAALDDDDSEDSSELQKAKPQQPDFSGDDNDDDGINDTTPNGHALQSTPTPERKARLLMRTEAVHKLVLNTPVYQGMTKSMVEPQGKFMMFVGFEEGKRETFQLKIGREDQLKELWVWLKEIAEDHDDV